MISTDRKIFESGSAVKERMAKYAKQLDELHIIVFTKKYASTQVHKCASGQCDEKIEETAIAPNCWAYPTRSSFKFLYSFNAINLGRFIISRRHIDNITCQDPFLTAMAGISLKKQFNIPLEIQLHTDISSPYYIKSVGNKLRKALALSYLPKADSIRVVSNRIKDYLISKLGIEQSKITIRPIFVDTEWIKNTQIVADLHKKYSQFEKIILIASRLEKEKNIGLAIQAFAEVLKKAPKTGLIIVGQGSQEKYLRACALHVCHNFSKNGHLAPSSIIFEPWANKETLASYYKTANLFLNTSFYEGYGMALVEAQAAGCKIISTDVGIAKELGATLVGYNAKEIAKTIISCMNE
jgi:glycosyltransferase involved in cell wall biosynthesis